MGSDKDNLTDKTKAVLPSKAE